MNWKYAVIIVVMMTVIILAGADTALASTTVNESLNPQENQEGPAPGSEEAPADGETAPAAMDNGNLWLNFVKMIGALAVVLGLLFWLLKFINKKTSKYQSTRSLQSIGGIGLGQNKSIQVVKVGDKMLVVGVGDTISLLQEIEDKEEQERITAQEQNTYTGVPSLLDKWKTRGKTEEKSSQSFQSVLEERLKKARGAKHPETPDSRTEVKEER
ncbi:flagellar biosynthetic protein FliO [Marinococcus luteus]|uniref:flagellar biosynthetic protein FliO n=1 Tax=Marinococcus luteus TaxID=1122204 RepID=UPI002ACC9F83|nr:flagellar biosynthetic protein FliO [Marinococcus luteus]MDZ5781821.1 flagellar biosynthetic protein FliO [Marinococcus luteus]